MARLGRGEINSRPRHFTELRSKQSFWVFRSIALFGGPSANFLATPEPRMAEEVLNDGACVSGRKEAARASSRVTGKSLLGEAGFSSSEAGGARARGLPLEAHLRRERFLHRSALPGDLRSSWFLYPHLFIASSANAAFPEQKCASRTVATPYRPVRNSHNGPRPSSSWSWQNSGLFLKLMGCSEGNRKREWAHQQGEDFPKRQANHAILSTTI